MGAPILENPQVKLLCPLSLPCCPLQGAQAEKSLTNERLTLAFEQPFLKNCKIFISNYTN